MSQFITHSKSKILETGYINVYSKLTPQEKRQLFYNRRYKKIKPSWDNSMLVLCKKFEKAIREINAVNKSPKLVVLDAGCGHGNYIIDEYREKIKKACGVDLDPQFTKKNVCLDEIKYANLEKIPYPASYFHVVISLWVIEHLKNPNQVFKEIHRVLKPGGAFIFAAPNSQCFLVFLKKLLIRSRKINNFLNKTLYGRDAKDVFSTYYKATDISTLQNFLKKTGFSKIKLLLNYDPGYTSFNNLTFILSNLANDLFGKLAPQLYKQHIIGYAQKPR